MRLIRRGAAVARSCLTGTLTRWLEGCDCDGCREAQNAAAKARFRRKAQERLPVDVRQQLLDAIYRGRSFRTALRALGLTSNQAWGLTKSDKGVVGGARCRIDRNPPGRPSAWHQCRVRGGLRVQRLPGAPAHQDGTTTCLDRFANESPVSRQREPGGSAPQRLSRRSSNAMPI
jgi:hypothetical protein